MFNKIIPHLGCVGNPSDMLFVLPSTKEPKIGDMIWHNSQIHIVNGVSREKRLGGKTTLYVTCRSTNYPSQISLEQVYIPNTKICLRVVKLEKSEPIEHDTEHDTKNNWGPNVAAAIFMMMWTSPFVVPLNVIPENSFFGLGRYLQFLQTFKCERLSKLFLTTDGSVDLDKIFNYGRAGNNYDSDLQSMLIKQLIGGEQ